MNDRLTEIVCIIDRSGSMEPLRDDTIGSFNTFVEAQRELPGEARLTLVLFDSTHACVHDAAPLAAVPPLTRKTYVTGACTALLDAVGHTIDAVGARLAATPEPERPGKVLVCIITDGCENASHRYSLAKVRGMIEHQQQHYSWEFLYLGANQDAFAEAGAMGIAAADSGGFVADTAGLTAAYERVHLRTRALRTRLN